MHLQGCTFFLYGSQEIFNRNTNFGTFFYQEVMAELKHQWSLAPRAFFLPFSLIDNTVPLLVCIVQYRVLFICFQRLIHQSKGEIWLLPVSALLSNQRLELLQDYGIDFTETNYNNHKFDGIKNSLHSLITLYIFLIF